MKTMDQSADPDTLAVIEHVMTGKPLDSALAERLRKEGEQIRQRIFKEHGLLDIAVPAIREFRGEIPE
jgi:hypothetical protein